MNAPRLASVPDPRDTTWKDFGLCAEVGSAVFYPERDDVIAAPAKAKAICARCPVQRVCLEYALDHMTDLDIGHFGVWGGTVRREREAILRARGRAA